MSDEDLFREAMRKVRPLGAPSRTVPKKRRPRIPQPSAGRARAGHDEGGTVSGRGKPGLRSPSPGTLVADGVPQARLRKLAAGQPPVDATLDLHGMTRAEALALLEQSLARPIRVCCIIHGRGMHSDSRPVLKDAVYRWLETGPLASRILAVIPEPGSRGGACRVLLRRSRNGG